MTTAATLSPEQQKSALDMVAAWLGSRMGYWDGCGKAGCPDCASGNGDMCRDGQPVAAPTGQSAADAGRGPYLNPEWDWPGSPTPTIILEGGPYDWATEACDALADDMAKIGVFAEPYSGWALCLYSAG